MHGASYEKRCVIVTDGEGVEDALGALWDKHHIEAAWTREPSASVPFTVFRVARPQVLWWNKEWFSRQGVTFPEEKDERVIRSWLTRHFAWIVASDDVSGAVDHARRTVALADRYGETGRSPQGGSGRVATFGGFQVKGVGRTPLVGQYVDAHHANGCAFVEEGIREAIFSEVAQREFPHGAMPVIAIIDIDAHHPDTGERRALIVRPACKRLAHLQRAPAFFPAEGDVRMAQLADAQRTRSFVNEYGRQHPFLQETLKYTLARIGEQVAHGQAHRLFHGGYFTSNLAVDGALLDYGSMRSVENWAAAQVVPHSPGFGAELTVLDAGVESIVMHLSKYLDKTLDSVRLKASMRTARQKYWHRQLLHLFSIPGNAPETGSLLADIDAFFTEQNAERVDLWRGHRSVQAPIHRLLLTRPTLAVYYAANPAAYENAISRLAPRPELDREHMQEAIFRMIAPRCSQTVPSGVAISAFIKETVERSKSERSASNVFEPSKVVLPTSPSSAAKGLT